MKKILLPFLILCLTYTFSIAQWQYVGPAGFSDARAGYQSLDVDGSITYVAYRDSLNQAKCTVKKNIGNNWQTVGSVGFSPDTADYIDIMIMNGTPYVTFKDWGNNKKVSVMMFDGSNWVPVGSYGISQGNSFYPYLSNYNNEIYVVYTDGPTGARASVQKFDGSNWSYVGNQGFSNTPSYRTSMTFVDSVPYISYREGAPTGFQASVMKFDYDSAKWVYEGAQGISAGEAIRPMINSANGQIYVIYADDAAGRKATVKTFNGTSWVDMGTPAFSADSAGSTDLGTDGANLYAAYTDKSLNNAVVVKMYDSGNWIDVGAPGSISVLSGYTIDIVLNNSIPVVAFRDENESFKTSVMKFDTTGNKPISVGHGNGNNKLEVNVPGMVWWFDCSNDSLVQADSSGILIPTYSGDYYAIVSNVGYLDTSSCESVFATGINEKLISQIKVFPNPSIGKLNILLPSEGITNFHINNLLGEKIQSFNTNDKETFTLNEKLESGIYFIQFFDKKQLIKTEKIFIH